MVFWRKTESPLYQLLFSLNSIMGSLAPSLCLFFMPSSTRPRHCPAVLCLASAPKSSLSENPASAPPAQLQLVNRRHLLSLVSGCSLTPLLLSSPAFGILEGDDDEQLLEKVKEDRKKKIQRRGEVNSYKYETASVQTAVYQLSKAGQALDGNDFSGAGSVLGQGLDVGWISDVRTALSKVSSSMEEQSEAEVFSSSITSLQSAVLKKDISLSKSAFVTSAGALEKWAYLTGFAEQLKGL